MRVYPFREYAEAIRDHIKSSLGSIPDPNFATDNPIEHDDHWYRPQFVEGIKAKAPAIYVAWTNSESQPGNNCDIEAGPLYTVTWLELAERSGEHRANAADMAGWLYHLFSDEDLTLPGYSRPMGVLIKQTYPSFGANWDELLDIGLVGVQVGIRVESSHTYEP